MDFTDTLDVELVGQDEEILRSIMDGASHVDVSIPEGVTGSEMIHRITLLCRVHKAFEKSREKLSRHMGIMLLWFNDHPKSYHGYTGFVDFLKRHIEQEMGISVSTCYNCMKLVKTFPTMPMDKWQELGTNKLLTLASFTKEGSPECDKYIEKAGQMTNSQLQEWAAEKDLIDPGESGKFSAITIKVTPNVKKMWGEFVQNAAIQAYTNTSDPGKILELAMAEVSVEWISQGQAMG